MIFIEGETIDKVLIIREGECKIELKVNPLQYIADKNNGASEHANLVDVELQNKRGLLSSTFANFLIGNFSKNEWVGNDFIYSGIEEYEYSAIATTDMLVYETTRNDISIMPFEFLNNFREGLKERQKWIRERIVENSHAISQILKKQESYMSYNETYQRVQKNFPMANKDLLLSIRKKILYKKKASKKMPELKLNTGSCLTLSENKLSTKKNRRSRMGSLNNLNSVTKLDSSKILQQRKLTIDSGAESIKKLIKATKEKAGSSSSIKLPLTKTRLLLNTSIVDQQESDENDRKLIPLYTQRGRKSKLENTPSLPLIDGSITCRQVDIESIKKHLHTKFQQKEYKNFVICRRTIEIMSKESEREKTPNPFRQTQML